MGYRVSELLFPGLFALFPDRNGKGYHLLTLILSRMTCYVVLRKILSLLNCNIVKTCLIETVKEYFSFYAFLVYNCLSF